MTLISPCWAIEPRRIGLRSAGSCYRKTFYNGAITWYFQKGLCDECYREFKRFMNGEKLRYSTEEDEV